MEEEASYELLYKVIIIGDTGVGKSNILSRYVKDEFSSNSKSTVGVELGIKFLKIKNTNTKIQIWDTAGQERYKSLTKSFFRNAEGVMLVYDVTNLETYENLKFWLQSIQNNMSSDMGEIPVVIIGNKIDCDEREVNTEEAEKFWKEKGYPYFETSAKTGENIDTTIKYLVKKVINIKEGKKDDENENIKIDKKDINKNNEEAKKCGC